MMNINKICPRFPDGVVLMIQTLNQVRGGVTKKNYETYYRSARVQLANKF